MKKAVNCICVFLCLLLCASVLFSNGMAVHGHCHVCMGEDCQYCQAASLLRDLMRGVLLCCFGAAVALVFMQIFTNANPFRGKTDRERTPVACKVKLTT